jgi:hypothetical protein
MAGRPVDDRTSGRADDIRVPMTTGGCRDEAREGPGELGNERPDRRLGGATKAVANPRR